MISDHSHADNTDLSELLQPEVPVLPTIPSHNLSKRQNIAKLIVSNPLFDPSQLQNELDMLKSRASLCPSKFRNSRMPQMSNKANLGRVASALPLPVTDGEILVEELIELGELCYWASQKNEHAWLYQRALSENLYNALIRLGPLFDLARVKRIFESSIGAGICSKKLIEAINNMVGVANKRVGEANKRGAKDNIFIFDATKILGDRFQPKFCSSVQIVMNPYHGSDTCAHKAQHFREVCLLAIEAYSRSFSECFSPGHCKCLLMRRSFNGQERTEFLHTIALIMKRRKH